MELRRALEGMDDVVVLYVVAANQWNPKSARWLDAHGLRQRVRFALDRDGVIDTLGLRRPNPEPVEEGVPHPATYVLDRDGVVRFVDVRTDFHFWLDPALPLKALAAIE